MASMYADVLRKTFAMAMFALSALVLGMVIAAIFEVGWNRELLRVVLLVAIPAASSGAIAVRGQTDWALALGFWASIWAYEMLLPQID